MNDDDLQASQLNVASDAWTFARIFGGVLLAVALLVGGCRITLRCNSVDNGPSPYEAQFVPESRR